MTLFRVLPWLLSVVQRIVLVEQKKGWDGKRKHENVSDYALWSAEGDDLIHKTGNPDIGQLIPLVTELIRIIVALFNLFGLFQRSEKKSEPA